MSRDNVGCLTSQQHASVSLGRICSDEFMCCHTETEVCRSNFLPHPVTVYWHRANQSQHWPYNARRLAGQPLECQFWSHWYDSTWKNPGASGIQTPDPSTLEADALTTRPRRQLSSDNLSLWLNKLNTTATAVQGWRVCLFFDHLIGE